MVKRNKFNRNKERKKGIMTIKKNFSEKEIHLKSNLSIKEHKKINLKNYGKCRYCNEDLINHDNIIKCPNLVCISNLENFNEEY